MKGPRIALFTLFLCLSNYFLVEGMGRDSEESIRILYQTYKQDLELDLKKAEERARNYSYFLQELKRVEDVWDYNGSLSLLEAAIHADSPFVVEVLCFLGSNVNQKASHDYWQTPLVCKGIEMGNVYIIGSLLKYGAKVHTQNSLGETPLHCAVTQKNETVVNMLLECGANPNRKNKLGQTPLDLIDDEKSEASRKIKMLLRHYGGNTTHKRKHKQSEKSYKRKR